MTAHGPYLPIAKPATGPEELAAVKAVLDSGWLTQGPWVKELETGFAARHEVGRALAVTSCTTALHLSLVALGVGPGDEVIVPALTWAATANVVVHCGATPVFADVRPDTFNIDPEAVARAVGPRTRAVIVVHLFGLPADMDALRAVIPPHVPVIEDAACAAGAAYKGRPAGGLGLMGCFSLHPRKSITCGEGGIVTTDDPDLAARIDAYRNHGAVLSEEARHRGPRPYELPEFEVFGFNYRMTDIQAAVAVVQLGKLDRFIAEREQLADAYDDALAGIDWLAAPVRSPDSRHAWQAYVATVDERKSPLSRNELLSHLHAQGVGARPGTHSVPGLKAYRQRFGTRPDDFPAATAAEALSVALPLHNHMTASDVTRVVDVLRSAA